MHFITTMYKDNYHIRLTKNNVCLYQTKKKRKNNAEMCLFSSWNKTLTVARPSLCQVITEVRFFRGGGGEGGITRFPCGSKIITYSLFWFKWKYSILFALFLDQVNRYSTARFRQLFVSFWLVGPSVISYAGYNLN